MSAALPRNFAEAALRAVEAEMPYQAPRPFPGQRSRDMQIAFADGCRVIQEAFGGFSILAEPTDDYPKGQSVYLTDEQFYAVQRAAVRS